VVVYSVVALNFSLNNLQVASLVHLLRTPWEDSNLVDSANPHPHLVVCLAELQADLWAEHLGAQLKEVLSVEV
jgi:hypothetical protein